MKYLKLKNRIKKLEGENFNLSWSKFDLEQENEELKEKIKDLAEEIKLLKAPKASLNINVSPEELAKNIVKKLKEEEEHKCTRFCFIGHVVNVIQKDYDRLNFKDGEAKQQFLDYWSEKLKREYDFVAYCYIVCDKFRVTFK